MKPTRETYLNCKNWQRVCTFRYASKLSNHLNPVQKLEAMHLGYTHWIFVVQWTLSLLFNKMPTPYPRMLFLGENSEMVRKIVTFEPWSGENLPVAVTRHYFHFVYWGMVHTRKLLNYPSKIKQKYNIGSKLCTSKALNLQEKITRGKNLFLNIHISTKCSSISFGIKS